MHQGCIETTLDAGNELEKGCEKIIKAEKNVTHTKFTTMNHGHIQMRLVMQAVK